MNEAVALPARRLGQHTAIEQTRAIAEVQAAMLVAHQYPRNVQAAIREMEESCKIQALAERAFYRFPRGGATVSGRSVYLARELARCWRNVPYGIAELARDDDHAQSEMLAWAWDLESNTRITNSFIVPHKRDKRGGPELLTDLRDVYENNSNMGARRLRECIFAAMPPWFVEQAAELCAATLQHGGGKPLAQRIREALDRFREIQVSEDDIERKLGRPTGKWDAQDLAQLHVIYTSIRRGEVQRDDEFPPPTVTAEEITGNAARVAEPTPAPPTGPPPEQTPVAAGGGQTPADQPPPVAGQAAEPKPPMDSNERRNRNRLHAVLGGFDLNAVKRRDDKLAVLSDLAGRAVDSSDDLTADEVTRAVDLLSAIARGHEADRPLAIAEHIAHGRDLRAARHQAADEKGTPDQ